VRPYKKRRLKFLAQEQPELLRKLEETGLVLAHTWDWEPAEDLDDVNWEELGGFEKNEDFVQEDMQAANLPAHEDWEIPF